MTRLQATSSFSALTDGIRISRRSSPCQFFRTAWTPFSSDRILFQSCQLSRTYLSAVHRSVLQSVDCEEAGKVDAALLCTGAAFRRPQEVRFESFAASANGGARGCADTGERPAREDWDGDGPGGTEARDTEACPPLLRAR